MTHSLLIAIHAACAVAAFVLGLIVTIRVPDRVNWTFRAYLIALALMIAFLVLVVVVDWPQLDTTRRGVYAGLLLLIGYTGWRAGRQVWASRGRATRGSTNTSKT